LSKLSRLVRERAFPCSPAWGQDRWGLNTPVALRDQREYLRQHRVFPFGREAAFRPVGVAFESGDFAALAALEKMIFIIREALGQ